MALEMTLILPENEKIRKESRGSMDIDKVIQDLNRRFEKLTVDDLAATVEKCRTCVWYEPFENFYDGILQVANMQSFFKKPIWTKERIPRPCCSTVWGFFLSFIPAKHPVGYLLLLWSLSSHLTMKWQTAPPTTVTKKEITARVFS